jgi:hypothetical protein
MRESGTIIIIAIVVYAAQHTFLASNIFSSKTRTGIGVYVASVALLITFSAVWVFQSMRYIP